ncbi:uroporphyrinogen-III synthase [Pseudomonas sp. F1_0610]|uniref:uroporphyrinogen-III synthase n=1 Tax=Pseudomonas sp. F1_0610 TaxID=3114284 RepID=UPI0039C40A08
MSNWRLLITRPEQDCQVLAQQLQEIQIFSTSMPLLAFHEIAETASARETVLNLDRYSAVVVVSKPAARIAVERIDQYWAQPLLEQPWFTVGAASAAILQDYGISCSYPQSGDDSEALLAHPAFITAIESAFTPRVLILRGTTGRDFLAQELRQKGVEVDFLALYERYLPDYPSQYLFQCINDNQLNGISISSEQSLQHLQQLAGDRWPELHHLPLFVPSPRVAKAAQQAGASYVIDCAGASNQALINALHQHSPLPNKD